MGLFHGPETLRLEHTKDAIVYNGDVSWKKEVEFDIKVEDIPRDCRLCFALYIKKNKVNVEADWQIGNFLQIYIVKPVLILMPLYDTPALC